MPVHFYFTLLLAVLTFIVAPIALLATFIRGMRTKASDRQRGGDGTSNAILSCFLRALRKCTPANYATLV